MDEARQRLIQPDEPPPFAVEQAQGRSPFFLTADHAGKLLPRKLGDLGLDAKERERHIAWDIGIAEVSRRLAVQLDAFLILQTYSRLVIDCNRAPEAASSIVTLSELTTIPGNQKSRGERAGAARSRDLHALSGADRCGARPSISVGAADGADRDA